MGAALQSQDVIISKEIEKDGNQRTRDIEKYFRPSCLPILNNQVTGFEFFDPYYNKKYNEITLPPVLMNSPDHTIINYFSILREAANLTKDQLGGCGTVGTSRIPYPVAYNFFTKDYQKTVPYTSYLNSFKGIGHINLIKVNHLPNDPNHPDTLQYFIELEAIEGSNKQLTYFAYYYGYVYLKKEGNRYKINNLILYGEDFLCAAYHLWQHNAEAFVDIKYGQWCKLVKKRLPTRQEGYVKTIDVIGMEGRDYRFVFFQLTNDTDILVSQYKKSANGKWAITHIDPAKCLEQD